MDSISQTKCALIYDTVISSQLGSEVINFFLNVVPTVEESDFILKIRDMLDENLYLSPKDFIDDVKDKFNEKVRAFGSESEISLSILTLLQLITDEYEKCFPSHDKLPAFEEFIQFKEAFFQFRDSVPNNRKEFKEFFNKPIKSTKILPRATGFEGMNVLDEQFDLRDLYDDIMRLKTDKDREKVVDIIVAYEVDYTHTNDHIEIDLSSCQPYTLKLIKQFVSRKLKEEYPDGIADESEKEE
ncbi:hypothetical protein TRFO_35523 [Tritrichomonas foetus]|uniref:NET domain-containing protein n=1 Tax=Tritrichomonas foetus TaxID=1144522 RepID=A0A1J4JHB2_9EUKA|nr:hypothetical protein TRFO_35523 [Tritrichomonas foetus]|eukprot:OHS98105.1 hypothetical protein TRFO_35523 [Tritrichomonas foetus]